MKKLILTFALACIALTLAGCNSSIPIEDCLITNMSTSLYHQIMKTENGYYYNYNTNYFGTMSLKYHDTTTGNDIYLCAKPECTHDGNTFCTATSGNVSVYYAGMYGGNIYIAAIEGTGKNQLLLKLLKASLDGTELTEICTVLHTVSSYNTIGAFYDDTRAMILHRGYAFIPYYLGAYKTKTMEKTVKTGLAIVNLSDGSVEYLPEYEQSEKDGYMNITPYGDYIYYLLNSKTEMHRYNFITGEDELLPVKENMKETYGNNVADLTRYTIIDDKVWYIYRRTSMFIYDPTANTTSLAEEFEEKFYYQTEKYDENGELYAISNTPYNNSKPIYDGKYLYIAEGGFYGSITTNTDMKVHIFTLEGDRLGGFVFERNNSACQINILDETFYIQTNEGTVFCPVSNVISGNIEWKELYQFKK